MEQQSHLQTIIGLIIAAGFAWSLFGGGLNRKVSDDAIKQFHIVSRSGTATERCVHADIVAQTFLQAKDETNYKKWKEI